MLFNLVPSLLNLFFFPQQNKHFISLRQLYENAIVQSEWISMTNTLTWISMTNTLTLSVYIPDNTYVMRTNKMHTFYINPLAPGFPFKF